MNKTYLRVGLVILALLIAGGVLFWQNRGPSLSRGEYASADISGLPKAQSSQTVELRNGDTYDLSAGYVRKEISGREYKMLAYNGSIPGPLLKIPQDAEVTINFKNDTDMKTLLHSHGVRMESAFDGAQTAQEEMEPGETFSYKLKFPDAGMYWYHPHVREDYEQELGLYGGYIATPRDGDYWSPVNREVPLFLDDVLIENGRIVLSKDSADRTLMGRFGNIMLVNGETNYSLSLMRGETVRFYITNAANTRPFNFTINGAKMKLVGADGGAYEKSQWVDAVTLGPSERAIIEVLFETSGSFAIQNKTPKRAYALGTVTVGTDPIGVSYASEFNQLRTHAGARQSIDPFRPYFDRVPDKRIKLTLDMGGQMMQMQGMGHGDHAMPDGTKMPGSMASPGEDGIEWEDENQTMNQTSNADSIRWKIVDQATGKENMDIDWTFAKGQPIKIRIFNDPSSMHPMQHPMHFHGQRFLVLERNGVKQTNFVWKDTVFIPSGETVDILLDTSNPGTWMAHCHIAEHLEAGMMMKFQVAQ